MRSVHIIYAKLDNYTLISKYCRSSTIGGGCCIFAKKVINAKELDLSNYECESIFEVCGLQCKIKSKTVIIINVYRPPQADFDRFIDLLLCMLEYIFTRNSLLFICGDFNVNLKLESREQRILVNVFAMFGLNMTVNQYTRVSANSKTLIDNIFSNVSTVDMVVSVGDTFLSDHRFVDLKINEQLLSENRRAISMEKRIFNSSNRNHFKYFLSHEQWIDVYDGKDLNAKFEVFMNIDRKSVV